MQEINNAVSKKKSATKSLLLMRLNGNARDEVTGTVFPSSGVSYVTNQKFGRSAAKFTTAGVIDIPFNNKYILNGDFTIEGWILPDPAAPARSQHFIISSSDGWYFDYLPGWAEYNNAKPCIMFSNSAANNHAADIVANTPWVNNGMHHFALVRNNGVLTAWGDGKSMGTVSHNLPWSNGALCIGNYYQQRSVGFTGLIQELVISVGARYTSPFNVPTTPFAIE